MMAAAPPLNGTLTGIQSELGRDAKASMISKTVIVDTESALCQLIESLGDVPNDPPSLYLDLEGEKLSRHGTIALLQIYVVPTDLVYLIDVHQLQVKAFSTSGKNGQTLKDILESETLVKVFFDVRNDSDALYSHFGIHLRGIQDLQLMELATRSLPRRYLSSLAKCIERDVSLSVAARTEVMRIKERGFRLFSTNKGGSYEVFARDRWIRTSLHIAHWMWPFALLWAVYNSKLSPQWREKVARGSKDRVKMSHAANYQSHGPNKALAPKGWF